MIKFILAAFLLLSGTEPDKIDSVVVDASRAGKDTPVTSSNIYKVELIKNKASSSLPQSLEMLPSVVATSEAGTGLGYTNFRVRGVGGTQTNVTLDGITLNEAESQEVFWVNIPALNQMLGSVQLQRGLGTSASGVGAFGASLNMNTASEGLTPGGRIDLSAGSFGTFTGGIEAHTGVLRSGLFARAFYSRQHTNGYVEGSRADVQSALAIAGWQGKKDLLQFMFLHGDQRSGISWEGCPWDKYEENPRFNPAVGATDNYRQDHFHLKYVHDFSRALLWHTVLNYTTGYGFYEYPPDGWSGSRSYLDDDLWVLRSELSGESGFLKYNGGLYLSNYSCAHFASSIDPQAELYLNMAYKREMDFWARAEWTLGKFVLYADVQYRGVTHDMNGPDEYSQILSYEGRWNFFNPRGGVSWHFLPGQKAYLSVALGHREPARADIQYSSSVKPERLVDTEAGWEFSSEKLSAAVTLFDMEYSDMLIETAELDSQGYPIKTNVSHAFRRGAEMEVKISPWKFLKFSGNFSASSNKIKGGSKILLSPSFLGGFVVDAYPYKGGEFRLSGKAVGRQQWDNSGREDRIVPAYFTASFMAAQNFTLGPGTLRLSLDVSNLFDSHYYAYAYSGGVFPVAPIAASLRLSYTL